MQEIEIEEDNLGLKEEQKKVPDKVNTKILGENEEIQDWQKQLPQGEKGILLEPKTYKGLEEILEEENWELSDKDNKEELLKKQVENMEEILEEEYTEVLPETEEKIDNLEERLDKNTKYFQQIKEDDIIYSKEIASYICWSSKVKELILRTQSTVNYIEKIIDSFNNNIINTQAALEEQEKKLVENRIKGINMIGKMSRNLKLNGLNKLGNVKLIEYNNISAINTMIEGKSDIEFQSIMNENYNKITHIKSKKSTLINMYFTFIEKDILPILDGIESGIEFVTNSSNDIIIKEILPVYLEMRIRFQALFKEIGVQKVGMNTDDKVDFNYVEVIDVEETLDQAKDERIENIIRDGYLYLEDIYGSGFNYVIRQVQVVAYKYKG